MRENDFQILKIVDYLNRYVVALILSLAFSSIVLLLTPSGQSRFYIPIVSFGFSLVISTVIDKITRRVYKPKLYNKERMKLVDIVNKVSGPKRDYQILEPEMYTLRFSLEMDIAGLFVAMITFFIFAILLSISIELGNPFGSKIVVEKFFSAYYMFFDYLFVLFFSVHFIYSAKIKDKGLIIYGLLLLITVSILIYLVISNFYALF